MSLRESQSANDKGVRGISTLGFDRQSRIFQLAMLIQDTPLSAAEPILVRFNPARSCLRKRFSGGGSNMTITGAKALTDAGIATLAIDGRVNLNLINLLSKIPSFQGLLMPQLDFPGRIRRL
ncbi:MAG: hypothetical protein IPP63_19420 [Chloracidobacterium sp.]|nr:hypothetical protein [Chloracidobacterium sp.]